MIGRRKVNFSAFLAAVLAGCLLLALCVAGLAGGPGAARAVGGAVGVPPESAVEPAATQASQLQDALSNIPDYAGEPSVQVNGDATFFTESEL